MYNIYSKKLTNNKNTLLKINVNFTKIILRNRILFLMNNKIINYFIKEE